MEKRTFGRRAGSPVPLTTTVGRVISKASVSQVRWAKVGIFYGIALGWAILIGAVLFALGQRELGDAATWVKGVLAVGYMPAPLVAALIVDRLDRRSPLMKREFAKGWLRRLPKVAASVAVLLALLMGAMLAASWVVGNQLDISGFGRLVFTPEDLSANSLAVSGVSTNAQQVATLAMPNLWVIVAITWASGVLVGLTINGLFAYGEEYGWRGWLADELRPLGPVWTNVVTGVLWGLWHAPLILLGFNYGAYRLPGVAAMILWCIAASFLLWRLREVTGTVVGAAAMHGAINGVAGLFLIALVDPSPLFAAPMGVTGIAVVAIVAALYWFATRGAITRAEDAVVAIESPTVS
jgi:uncharacterized protein